VGGPFYDQSAQILKIPQDETCQTFSITGLSNYSTLELYVQNLFLATGIGISSETKHVDFFPHFRRITKFRDLTWFYSAAPFQSWTHSKTNCFLTLLSPKNQVSGYEKLD
jgi:hypothetical protein